MEPAQGVAQAAQDPTDVLPGQLGQHVGGGVVADGLGRLGHRRATGGQPGRPLVGPAQTATTGMRVRCRGEAVTSTSSPWR